MIDHADLDALFRLKHGDPASTGWAPSRRHRFDYFTPDDVYEALVEKLVRPGCSWLDVGCGRDLFPGNPALGRILADRSEVLVGVDPDATIEENEFVHERARCSLEDYKPDRLFDLVTLRMVAEHVEQPEAAVETLGRLTRAGGQVVVYTVSRWSPLAIAARFLPFGAHHPLKRVVWGTEERDTFPVAYRMNSRAELARLFEAKGFREVEFRMLADCRVFGRFRFLGWLELALWKALRRTGLHYPEQCLLGVYEKS